MVRVGEKIPDFSCRAITNNESQTIHFSSYQGRWTVLFFYTKDETSVCSSELKAFDEFMKYFSAVNASVIGASIDTEESHKKWFTQEFPNLSFPVLSDTNHEVAKLFGIMNQETNLPYRGTFIIDPQGIMRYSSVLDLPVGRSAQEVLRVLCALQTGEFCPADWKPGEHTFAKV